MRQKVFEAKQLVDTLGTGFFSETNLDLSTSQELPVFDCLDDAINFINEKGILGTVYQFDLRTPEEYSAELERVKNFNQTKRENTLPLKAEKKIGMGDRVWISDPTLASIGERLTKKIVPYKGGAILTGDERRQKSWDDICEISEDDELILSNITTKI